PWALVPLHHQRIAALQGGPGVIREHGNAGCQYPERLARFRAIDANDIAHAGDLARRTVVQAGHAAVEIGAAQHDRGQGPAQVFVDSVATLAGDDLATVRSADRFANQGETLGTLWRGWGV